MKKIAIDCRVLGWKHSGIARYLASILVHLLAHDKQNQYYLLTPTPIQFSTKAKNVKIVELRSNEFLYKYWYTPKFIKKEKIDLYWSPSQDMPLWKSNNCRYVITIHDVAYEHDSSPYSMRVKVLHALGFYRTAAIQADCIITDSRYSKDDIVQTYKISKKKIQVIYLGVDDTFIKIPYRKALAQVKKLFSLDGEYIFYINTGRPERLYQAFSLFLKKADYPITLVSIGKSVTPREDIPYLIKEYHLSSHIRHISTYLSDQELNVLYAGSKFFVCPSYFEGFGLTPLEAIKSGAKVLSSDVTALPEILSDCVWYCNPYSVEDIAKKMEEMLHKRITRQKLNLKYSKLLKIYTWENTAKNILRLFNSL